MIPARGGSKGIPRKNLRPLCGKPLLQWTVDAARAARLLDRIVVSTEDAEIAAVAARCGAEALPRPPELATDATTTLEVVQHVVQALPADVVVVLQPTSPVRSQEFNRPVHPPLAGRTCGFAGDGAPGLLVHGQPRWSAGSMRRLVKNWNFWMPFAPVILEERQHDYLVNPKSLESPYMTLGFETTALARHELPAALHPYDFTARPQILAREDNPASYDLVKAFERRTGVGALLNTSFNLHGELIVCTLEDAWRVFTVSGLDGLLLGTRYIEKLGDGTSAGGERARTGAALAGRAHAPV